MKLKHALLLTTPLLTSATAYAGTFTAFDARSAAMGGTGVASAQIVSAPFYNPAMLAAQREDENFSLLIGAGVSAQDDDNLLQHLNDFADAINAGNTTTADSEATLASAAKPASISVNTAAVLGWAGTTWSMALVNSGSVQADIDFIKDTGTLANSSLSLAGVESKQTGFALARKFGAFSVGLTPKMVKVTSYSTSVTASSNSDVSKIVDSLTTSGTSHGSNFNLDAGLVYNLSDALKVGVVQQNLMSKSYTSGGKTFSFDSSTRAGIAYTGSIVTLAADYDLTKSSPIISGGEQTQFMALGAEFDLFNSVQLRAGYNKNVAVSGSKPTTSVGLGFNLLAVQLDLTAMQNNNAASVFLQIGARW